MCNSLLNVYEIAQLNKLDYAAETLHQILKTENAAQVFEKYQTEYKKSLYK